MRKTVAAASTLLILAVSAITALAADGIINVKSSLSAQETAARLGSILTQKGMTIFNRIPHSAIAAPVGVNLRNTELVIFGNPRVGSPLMKCKQSVAIDLPQKALIWEDETGQVWISYNDPKYLKKRHSIKGCEEVIAKIEKALADITRAATTE